MIDFQCPKCKEILPVPSSMIGKTETCPNCGNVSIIFETKPAEDIPKPQADKKDNILWWGKPSWKGFLAYYVLAVLVFVIGIIFLVINLDEIMYVGIVVMIIGGIIIMLAELQRKHTEYRITDKIIYLKTGILSLSTTEVPIAARLESLISP